MRVLLTCLFLFVGVGTKGVAADSFSIASTQAVGKACDASAVTASISPDGATLTVTMPDNQLEVPPGRKIARATCDAIVTVTHPETWAPTTGTPVFSSHGPGRADVSARVRGSQCGAPSAVVIVASIVTKSTGKTTIAPTIKIPLTWIKCAKKTHN